jgi:hypothetical protein
MVDDTYTPVLWHYDGLAHPEHPRKGVNNMDSSGSYKSWRSKQKRNTFCHMYYLNEILSRFLDYIWIKIKYNYVYNSVDVTSLNLFFFLQTR